MPVSAKLATVAPALLAALSGVAVAWLTARPQRKGCRLKVEGIMEVEARTSEEAQRLAELAFKFKSGNEEATKPPGTSR